MSTTPNTQEILEQAKSPLMELRANLEDRRREILDEAATVTQELRQVQKTIETIDPSMKPEPSPSKRRAAAAKRRFSRSMLRKLFEYARDDLDGERTPFTQSQVCQGLGLSSSTVSQAFRQMREELEVVRMVGRDGNKLFFKTIEGAQIPDEEGETTNA